MQNISGITLTPQSTVKDALEIIDQGQLQIAIVIDDNGKLIGTLTDGDIRRGFLSGRTLESPIKGLYSKNPIVAHIKDSRDDVLELCTSKKVYQIPVIDDSGVVIGVDLLDEILKPNILPNKVVLMVGGLGSRLRPLTEHMPKPMLKVGGKPILQTIVERFANHGFINITFCVNYKSDIIQEHFGDGSEFGAHIDYIFEEKRMGTAGALSLLNEMPKDPFFVMNGDLLTNVNFEHLLDFHLANNSMATMCVREYDMQVPYGVVSVNEGQILSLEEKPIHKFFVNAGIYMLDPACLNNIPLNEFYDMPSLFDAVIASKQTAASFPIREYWLDIGQLDEYEKANNEYHEVF